MKKFYILFVLAILPIICTAQTGTFKGVITDAEKGEPIMYANVMEEHAKFGASTDINGFFLINKIQKGQYTVKVQCLGYADTTLHIEIQSEKSVTVNIELRSQAQTLDIVNIVGEHEIAKTESRVSVKKILAADIQKMPSIGGMPDLAQYIQVLPGVVFSGDQGGQLYIRGGSAIQNKVLLDGMVIFNPFHSIGLFSVFETDIIRNADIYTGGFNAKYGGRLSSIMDISTRDGNKKNTSGKISVSTFGASAILEGPIIADKEQKNYTLSYLLTAKNSYLSSTSKSLYNYLDSELPYDFFDMYGKVTLASKSGSKINLFGFNFTDKVKSFKNMADFNWSNVGAGTNVLLVPQNSPSVVRAVLAYSKYKMNMDMNYSDVQQSSSISSFSGTIDVTRFLGKNQMNYGVEIMGNTTKTLLEGSAETLTDYSTDAGAYMVFKGFVGKLLYEPSVRFAYYASLSESSLEPRLSVKYNLTENFRIKGAAGLYSQSLIDTKSDRDIVNLFTGYLTASPDLYGGVVATFNGEKVDKFVEKAKHFIIGAEYDVTKRIAVNAELYYKTMSNMIAINRDRMYNNDTEHASAPDYLKKNFAVEDGKALGGDISLKYSDGRLYVWTIYSFGKVERTNENTTYNPHYDRRHNINVLISYQMGLDRSWEISARWNYGSGFPYTPTSGFAQTLNLTGGVGSDYVTSGGTLTTMYGEMNSRRLPSYHRLDISAKKRFNVFRRSVIEIEASVTNIYDRNNLFYFDRVTAQRVDQLPIMPSLGLTWRF